MRGTWRLIKGLVTGCKLEGQGCWAVRWRFGEPEGVWVTAGCVKEWSVWVGLGFKMPWPHLLGFAVNPQNDCLLVFQGDEAAAHLRETSAKLLEYGAFGQLENRDKQEVSRRDNTRHVAAMSHWNK